LDFLLDIINGERRHGDTVHGERFLEQHDRRMTVRSEREIGTVNLVRHDRQPTVSPDRKLPLFNKHLGVEAQASSWFGTKIVVNTILMGEACLRCRAIVRRPAAMVDG
jgi:hypothetical protein